MTDVIQKRSGKKATDQEILNKNQEGMYSPKNISKKEQYKIITGDKTKIIEVRTYKNGVIKRELVGLLKGKKVMVDKGINKKQFDME